uniref:Uncharacterized protein n=1 Tax=Spongospora subterranea TaxID=70186 RepID=A0A0H5QXH9_9EUKA|eukprot:CRZ06442.1 hypothetical protein [Spongospora subterranea]
MALIPDQHVDHIQLSRSWYYSGFLLRQGFSIRRWSNHKKLAASQSSPAIFKFHQNLFSQFSQSPTVDTKYGFYKPSSVFNFDQVLEHIMRETAINSCILVPIAFHL